MWIKMAMGLPEREVTVGAEACVERTLIRLARKQSLLDCSALSEETERKTPLSSMC